MEASGAQAIAGTSAQPHVLVAASTWWPSSARLATALMQAGCRVSAICPPGHPLRYVSDVRRVYTVRGLRSRSSLLQAIRDSRPDFVIPCDDRIVAQLHQLFGQHPQLRALIERSLGDPAGFEIADSRSKLLKAAMQLGIRVPRGAVVATAAEAQRVFGEFGPVAVMKIDGTHGGEGVRIVRSPEEAAAAFRNLRFGSGFLTSLQRFMIYGDPLAMWSWTQRGKSEITIQEFISGTPANNMVACWQGKILGEVSVEAVTCKGQTGSANVVRRIDSREFSRAAELIGAHTKASGFFGLDFIIEQPSGTPYLIEMNPRCTQLGHLQIPGTADLASALCERLCDRPRRALAAAITQELIAFFPQAWLSSSPGDNWYSAFQDIPWEEKSLVQYLMHEPWPDRRWQARAYRLLRGPKRQN